MTDCFSDRQCVSANQTFWTNCCGSSRWRTSRARKTVAAYARDDLLEKRRPVMQAWSDYVTVCTGRLTGTAGGHHRQCSPMILRGVGIASDATVEIHNFSFCHVNGLHDKRGQQIAFACGDDGALRGAADSGRQPTRFRLDAKCRAW